MTNIRERYDMRGITYDAPYYRCRKNLCSRCGIDCGNIKEINKCKDFVPIIPFRPKIRGMIGNWNTFRIGTAWYYRLNEGAKVAILNTKTKTIERYETVKFIDFGTKEQMCAKYAKDNHNIVADDIVDNIAETMLQRMNKNYGRKIFEATEYATVIYF